MLCCSDLQQYRILLCGNFGISRRHTHTHVHFLPYTYHICLQEPVHWLQFIILKLILMCRVDGYLFICSSVHVYCCCLCFFWHALSFSWKTAAASLELTLLCSGLAWLGNSCEYSRLMVIKPYVWFFGYSSSHILEGEKFFNVIFSLRERERERKLINHLRVYFNYLSMIWKVCKIYDPWW